MAKPDPTNLAEAVCAVMADVANVDKSGKNAFHGYEYASEADLLRALRPAMTKHGLALIPVATKMERIAGPPTGKGKEQWITSVAVTYRLMHGPSKESCDVQVPGCGIDGEDKGAYKAMTGALKYALRQTFLVPTGDDPDQGGRDSSGGGDDAQAVHAARTALIRAQYEHGEADGYDGHAWARRLKEAGCPTLEDVRWFCLWLGREKPSQLTAERRDKLVTYLQSERGKADFADFAKQCGVAP